MAAVQLFAGTDRTSIAATTVRFYPVANACIITSNSTEANAQMKMTASGTFSLMGCYVSANDRGDATLRFKKNGSNVNQTITLTNTVTGQFEDGSGTDSTVDDDLINYSLTPGGGGTSFIVTTFWQTYTPSSGTVTIVGSDFSGSLSGTTDQFFALNHCVNNAVTSATEANYQNTIPVASTMGNAQIRISANTRSDTTLFKSRRNGADGNISIQYLTTVTGLVEDTGNTDTISDGDEMCWTWDQNAGTGSMTMRNHKVEFSATNAFPIMTMNASASSQANNTTSYMPVGGDSRTGNTVEADAQQKSNVAFTWTDLYSQISDFSLSGGGSPTASLRTRVNGADVNMVISGINGTGQISDTSNTDTVSDDQEINFVSVTGGTAGQIRYRTMTTLAAVSAGGGRTTKNNRAFEHGVERGMNRRGF